MYPEGGENPEAGGAGPPNRATLPAAAGMRPGYTTTTGDEPGTPVRGCRFGVFAMFGFFLFAVLFVALCLFTAEPAPQVITPVPVVEDDLPSLGELLAETEALTARPVPAVAAEIAAPVAIARVEVAPVATDYAAMSSQELRRECSRRGIAWRGVREGGKHLTKPQMVKALA